MKILTQLLLASIVFLSACATNKAVAPPNPFQADIMAADSTLSEASTSLSIWRSSQSMFGDMDQFVADNNGNAKTSYRVGDREVSREESQRLNQLAIDQLQELIPQLRDSRALLVTERTDAAAVKVRALISQIEPYLLGSKNQR